jgi:predicted dehydrogenase
MESAPKQTLRIGIIGHTGRGDYGHGVDQVWKKIPETQVIAVADPHPGGRAKVVKETGAKQGYADYREMLDKEKFDLVAVCPRWIDQHHAMLMAAAEHGCHVYMEKPFCPTLEQADEVVQALDMRHLKLGIAHIAHYTPQLAHVKTLIADGEIGDVLELRARGKEDRRGGGEDLWVLGSHMLDLMRAIAGDVAWCFARVTTNGRPITKKDVADGAEGLGPLAGDGVDAMYSFQNGIRGHFASHRDMAGNPSRFGLMIYGSKGVIELPSGFLETAWLLKDSHWASGSTKSQWQPISSNGLNKSETRTDKNYAGGHPAAVNDLLEAIKTDRQPVCGAKEALAATEMILGVFESQRQNAPVPFPLKNRKHPLTMLKD